ncbi:unnamed protein product [Rotaria magnacalcarata]|uniref:Uncharacterized protein n=1 Tax=Rotaria magnacalcarata TaxID=392030 RepID=A0A817A2K3_9BILA|nr:unnamed protein product [Rotaria magnacalcarata]CAF1601633.1 unnamed protein product [Rotaria magnacalcarata]CAF1980436.1 unnamed protein product [Rotaria magnacalcarata]CAF2166295.1 unnamed protein product [Rotaria magnacalcarata]CAF2250648.1 unnamed protein product [Rotaria magnacalcarata]
MAYNYYDEHDEDDLPVFSSPGLSLIKETSYTSVHQEDDMSNDRSSGLIENWKTLYERSLHSLKSTDEDRVPTSQSSIYLRRQPSVERPSSRTTYSPIYQRPFDLNTAKSRWEIRLPQLLDTTVGPDRPKRDFARRHTTNIVFQRPTSNNDEFNAYGSSQIPDEANNDRPIAPLVKQITHKFDQMKVNNEFNVTTNNYNPLLSDDPSKLHRVTSLTSRRLTTDNSGRFPPKSRPMLPLRPIADLTTSKMRSASTESLNSHIPTNNSQFQRSKIRPPISYPKYFYPPPSTTSVIKQLIGGSATLVYDSRTESRSSNTSSPDRKQQKGVHQIADHLSSTNSNLLGRQRKPKSPDSAYETLKNKRDKQSKLVKSKVDEPDPNQYEHLSRRASNNSNSSSEKDYVSANSDTFDKPTRTNNNISKNYYPTYDAD